MVLSVQEFVRMVKHGTLLYHQGSIDRIVHEFTRTRDLIVQVGSRDVVLESAYLASLSYGNPSLRVPCSKTMFPSRVCSDTPSPPDPMLRPYRTRKRSRES